MRRWKGIVIHHSVSDDVSWATIDRWHRENGWNGIGYHFVIRANGMIEPGRSLDVWGAHALNPRPSRNPSHIGIVLTGNFNEAHPTLAQQNSLAYLIGGLMNRFGIDFSEIEQHHSECPGKNFPWEGLKFKIKLLSGEEDKIE